ncbi:MAG: NTP transferase domain-containing protein, partial [Lachnospiraceae bacterium]|nr:NTP transferase domain-containing protein [Lachnospiraceae bacterium]
MKALILNSGLGRRMGVLTSEHPKCMTEISSKETILSRQLNMLEAAGIEEVVITTGYFDAVLVQYCQSLDLKLNYTFVNNPIYDQTNYIYSIYCARNELDDDILLMHGDLVFENEVLDKVLESPVSCMTVSSTLPLPEKDFKAQVCDGMVMKVGVDIFNEAMEAQALYKLHKEDWKVWLGKICEFCESGNTKVYAENALNELNGAANIAALDVEDLLCAEIDNPEDLAVVSGKLAEIEARTVYMSFSTDIIHGGHIAILRKAQKLGRVIVGVLSDEAVASYKRLPLVPASERKVMFENLAGVYRVVDQNTLRYKENLETYRPDFVVHGDDWCTGFQKPIRDEVVSVLASYGGKLVEYPYSKDKKYMDIDARTRADLSMPDIRRGRLRRVLDMKGLVTAMEAHDGLTGL